MINTYTCYETLIVTTVYVQRIQKVSLLCNVLHSKKHICLAPVANVQEVAGCHWQCLLYCSFEYNKLFNSIHNLWKGIEDYHEHFHSSLQPHQSIFSLYNMRDSRAIPSNPTSKHTNHSFRCMRTTTVMQNDGWLLQKLSLFFPQRWS